MCKLELYLHLQGHKKPVVKEEDFCKLEMVISKEIRQRYFLHSEILFGLQIKKILQENSVKWGLPFTP